MRSAFSIFILASVALAQSPTIGIIDIYGARSVPPAEIVKRIGVSVGGHLPASKGAVEERLEKLDEIVIAKIEATCCEEGKVILYVGIEERGATHFEQRLPPLGEVALPEVIVNTYGSFLTAVQEAGRAGSASEDLSQGHSLLADPTARALQTRFTRLADEHLQKLQEVLRNSNSPEFRAVAAYIIGYASRKTSVVNDLQYALQDSDETVRSNAARALAAFAVLANKQPNAELKISPTWLIEMLNSVTWTDRNNAAVAMVTLTNSRDPRTLQQLRERALPSLIEMASWQHLPHALPAYILLGRTASIPETELQDAWSKGQRQSMIKRASSSGKR